jgi:hypothetical protein
MERRKALLRKSSMYMIAGQPGAMKTMFALNIVRRLKVPTMYFSNDSDDMTMTTRALAMTSGASMSETEQWIKSHTDYAQAQLKDWNHVKWSFHSGPSLDHIEREMDAFAEIHGRYPEHTVIDILMNVDYEGAGEQNYWGLMAELHDLSRKWETALGIVHHSSESVKGEPCPPRHAIMGKANQLPTLIMTLAPRMGFLDIAVVKNRFGESDLTGKDFFSLPIEPWCSRVNESAQKENDEQPAGSGLRPGRVDGGSDHGARGEAGSDLPDIIPYPRQSLEDF